jgi:hypothetical protein
MKIELNEEDYTITCGEWQFDCVKDRIMDVSTTKSRWLLDKVLGEVDSQWGELLEVENECCDIEGFLHKDTTLTSKASTLPTKEFNKVFTDTIKITPSKFLRLVRDMQWSCLVEGLSEKVLYGCFRTSPFKRWLTLPANYKQVKPYMVQCVEDGLDHLTPIVAYYGKSPDKIKKLVGKSVWKKLANNSLTRNGLIAQRMPYYSMDVLVTIPSSMLKHEGLLANSSCILKVVADIAKKRKLVTNKAEVAKISNTVLDTCIMKGNLNQTYSLNWSWKRWQEEHDKANKEVLLRKYSDERFRQDVYNYLEEEVVVEEVGTATLLVSPLEVATEGKKMRHCVGGYANMCERGNYAVYHIVDVDGKEATAGYRINIIDAERGSLELSQCYSYQNTKASDKCLDIAKLVGSKKIVVKEGECLYYIKSV